jgi:hypothetical protein
LRVGPLAASRVCTHVVQGRRGGVNGQAWYGGWSIHMEQHAWDDLQSACAAFLVRLRLHAPKDNHMAELLPTNA